MKDRLRQLISKRIFKHLGIMIIILIVVMISLNSWLSSYTSHGETQTVPDFSGKDMVAAEILAAENNLIIKVHDTLFSENCRPGTIIDHTPSAGEKVKEQRTIFVSLNSTGQIMVTMPKVYEVSLRQAQHILARSGLLIGRIEYKPDFAENYVFEQLYKNQPIKAGERIPKGSKISLVVGKGSLDTKTIVPSIMGETYQNVTKILDSLGITYNAIFSEAEYKDINDSLQAVVWKQSPTSGDNSLMMYSQILDFWLKPISIDTLDKIE